MSKNVSFILIITSVTFNIGLLFTIYKLHSNFNATAPSSINLFERFIEQNQELGNQINERLPLVYGTDTTYFGHLLTENVLFFLTGYKNCSSCLERELHRLKNGVGVYVHVIADVSMEEELRYFWRTYDMDIPIHFTSINNLNFNLLSLDQPLYFKLTKDFKVQNMLSISSAAPYEFAQTFIDAMAKF